MARDDPDEPADPLDPNWVGEKPVVPGAPAELAQAACWRCGRCEPPIAGRCPRCDARLSAEPEAVPDYLARGGETAPLPFVLFVYALFLLTSIIWGWVILANRSQMTHDQVLTGLLIVELVDTVLVLAALAMVGRFPLPERRGRILVWTLALPALGLLLVVNVAYTLALREYIKPPDFLTPPAMEITLVTVGLVCFQPAIVEELLFRYLALGVLARATNTATAVWVSAVMFAMAHIYNPLGLPYLFVAGVVFGIARVYGGLLLPIVLHFIHNFAVMAIEVMK